MPCLRPGVPAFILQVPLTGRCGFVRNETVTFGGETGGGLKNAENSLRLPVDIPAGIMYNESDTVPLERGGTAAGRARCRAG